MMQTKGDRAAPPQATLVEMGVPVFNGAFSTFLAVLTLSLAVSYSMRCARLCSLPLAVSYSTRLLQHLLQTIRERLYIRRGARAHGAAGGPELHWA